ncbi:MAG: hypothetical protein ACUVR4_12530 [Anaerolineae bacterium]
MPVGAPTTGMGEVFQIALPRLVVDIERDGMPSILGVNPLFLKTFGVDVSGFKFPPATVETMIQAGIQHVELASIGDRLVILVNGKPMPQLDWNEEAMQRALALARVFDVQNTETISKLLPWVTRLGLNIVVRFPRDGAAEIPLSAPGTVKTLTVSPHTDPPSMIVKFEVKFDQNGEPGILGVTASDLAKLGVTGLGRLAPETILKLQEGNVQHLEIRNKPDGLYLYFNGEPLPRIIWDGQWLANVVEVYGGLDPQGALKPLIEALLPTLDRADIGILLHFPLAPGAQPISSQMHE